MAIRIARDSDTARTHIKKQQLVDALPEFSFALPRSAGPAIEQDGIVAVPTIRLRGKPHPAGSGDPKVLAALLDEIQATPVEPFSRLLAERHAFCGGPQWLDIMASQVLPLFSPAAQKIAQQILDQLSSYESDISSVDFVLSHGDLAGSNMLFEGSKVVGVLDWDLAALDDPAVDVACLAAWHGSQIIQQIAGDSPLAARAHLLRASDPLQIVAFDLLHGRSHRTLSQTVAKAEQGLHRLGR
ncbi:phosphotransferase [Rothia nasimurium]|uniref:phosphotransferase n=1 Tax=Rothia nasimurium TaxID=85336 RepID=UPI001F15BDA8